MAAWNSDDIGDASQLTGLAGLVVLAVRAPAAPFVCRRHRGDDTIALGPAALTGKARFPGLITGEIPYADEAMEPLPRPDDSRSRQGHFEPLDLFVGGWVIEFNRVAPRSGLLRHLESLPWPDPGQVQVLIHDEEDDCFAQACHRNARIRARPGSAGATRSVSPRRRFSAPADDEHAYGPRPDFPVGGRSPGGGCGI